MSDEDQPSSFEETISDLLNYVTHKAHNGDSSALHVLKNLRDALVARQAKTGESLATLVEDAVQSKEALAKAFARPDVGYNQQLALNQYKSLKINVKPGADHKSNFHPAALHRPAKGVH